MSYNKASATLTLLPLLLLIVFATATSSTPSEGTCRAPIGDVDDQVDLQLVPPRREIYGGGSIIDITHRIREDMACWERKVEGLGPYLRLQSSMKTGSIAYFSEIKLPTHIGTHVDAPGHMIDRYFDAGFDVDTLDLDVLNGWPSGKDYGEIV
ncbi:hypothetical protein Sjap_022820 [Stephania japonica]|uniref:Cyclase n=1 Tax=Stephania japonica TaxID=461633 RepID=A0AAP0EV98_9MAGN